MKKWRQRAEEKSKLDEQTEEIHQKFKMDKINKEFGQLSGEEFFKPITKRLDEKSTTVEEEEEKQEVPDYTMDEFDETYPFGDEFRPDAPTPSSSPPPPPPYDDGDDFPPPPPPLMEETSKRKEWAKPGPVEPEYQHESTLLQTVNQLITKYGNDPNYKVGKSKLGLKGKTIAELKKIRDGIDEKRRVTKESLFSKRLQEGKKRLKSTSLQEKRERPLTPLEKTVMSRRPAFELSDNEDDSYEQDWETEGSGFYDDEVEKLINQLNLSFASIKAGNSSIKLKKQVFYLLDSLVELGRINENQKKKLFHLYKTMVFGILLDSSLTKLERGGERNVSHDFTVNFYPPIELGKGNYKAALNRLITMSYSWNNIDSRYDNNKIRWKKKTEQVWKTLTFPNGMYDKKE